MGETPIHFSPTPTFLSAKVVFSDDEDTASQKKESPRSVGCNSFAFFSLLFLLQIVRCYNFQNFNAGRISETQNLVKAAPGVAMKSIKRRRQLVVPEKIPGLLAIRKTPTNGNLWTRKI